MRDIKSTIKDIVEKHWEEWKSTEVEYAFDEWLNNLPENLDKYIEKYGNCTHWYSHPDNYSWEMWEWVWELLPDNVKKEWDNDFHEFDDWTQENDDIYELQTRFWKEVSDEVNGKIENWLREHGYAWTYHNIDTDQPEIYIYKK